MSDDETEPLNLGVNMDAEMQIDSTILKLAEQRAAIDVKRKDLNESAREINSNIDKLGINPSAFMLAVRLIKGMPKGERNDFIQSVRRVTKVVGERQAELWPEETSRQEKKAEQAKAKKAKAGRTSAEMDADSDANPKSDPKRGGAGRKSKAKDSVEELNRAPLSAEATAAEEAAGDAILSAGLPLSQSAQAAAVRDKLGL